MAQADTRPVGAEDVERIRELRRRASERGRWRAVEEAFEAGLRNHWYALAPSSALAGANPFALRRMGEDLVLWRDATGALHLFVDSCAHRGARLSLGAVVGTGCAAATTAGPMTGPANASRYRRRAAPASWRAKPACAPTRWKSMAG